MIEDFWIWLPKAYGDVGDEPVFTKYNMEVAFGAGAEAEAKRMWQGLTADEIWQCNTTPPGSDVGYHICMAHQNVLDFAEAIEAKIKEKNGYAERKNP